MNRRRIVLLLFVVCCLLFKIKKKKKIKFHASIPNTREIKKKRKKKKKLHDIVMRFRHYLLMFTTLSITRPHPSQSKKKSCHSKFALNCNGQANTEKKKKIANLEENNSNKLLLLSSFFFSVGLVLFIY